MNLEAYFNTFIKELNGYYFELGVVSGKSERKINIGVTNADLMFIHENGSPIRNIPSRPVLQLTIDWARKDLIDKEYMKALDAFLDNGLNIASYERVLKQTAMKIESYARDIIYSNDGRLKENSPSVARKKGGSHPLFDTGQLARSITCRLCKNGEVVK